MIRAGSMGMSPYDQTDAAITKMSRRLLFARCLAMEIDDDGIDGSS